MKRRFITQSHNFAKPAPVESGRNRYNGFANYRQSAHQWSQYSTVRRSVILTPLPCSYQAGVFTAFRICRAKADKQSSPPTWANPSESVGAVVPSCDPVRKSNIQMSLLNAGIFITDSDINGSDEWTDGY